MNVLPQVVLIGGGHTHVQVLRRQAMNPLPADFTLVVDQPIAIYSGMVPGLVAGQYAPHDVQIDVRPLARRAGVRVIQARAERVDPENKRVILVGRPPIAYDIASLNIGSTVAGRNLPGVMEFALPTRPIADLVTAVERRLPSLPKACEIVIVGAGAGGVELAFCLDARVRALKKSPTTSMVFSSARVLPKMHPSVGARIEAAAARRGIHLRAGLRATEVTHNAVICGDESIPANLVVWVVGADGFNLGRASGLAVDTRGFIWIDDDLRAKPDLFAVGDCAVLRSWPEIPKAGVYAVREGPVLIHNLERLLQGRDLIHYAPQRDFFGLLNLGDGTAVGSKWGLSIQGAWAMSWKHRIDQAFMDKFQVLGPTGPSAAFERSMPPMPELEMVCGGCAAKVGQNDLTRALSRLPSTPPSPAVVLGLEHADDAVAWEHEGVVWVQNVDAFPAFVDDPWIVGRVAAHNANSDLYAKGVQPQWAMASVQIPESAPAEETLFQVLAGLRDVLDTEGIVLLGGHSLVGEKLVVGLTVTGAASGPLWTIDRAQAGDTVLLTRPLGTGVLLHADMAGRARGPDVGEALQWMGRGNRAACDALRPLQVHAVTDVTGFGLAGHAAEVARASGVSIQIDLEALPPLAGVLELLDAGERSTFHDNNRALAKALRIERAGSRTELCFDPQTAGGLLFTTDDPDGATRALEAAGEPCWAIGRVEAARSDGAPVVLR